MMILDAVSQRAIGRPDREKKEPLRGREAFYRSSLDGGWSAAAQTIGIARQLKDAAAFWEDAGDEAWDLGVPAVVGADATALAAGREVTVRFRRLDTANVAAAQSELWSSAAEGNSDAAAAIVWLGLERPEAIVRTAAAASLAVLGAADARAVRSVLHQAERSSNPTIRGLADVAASGMLLTAAADSELGRRVSENRLMPELPAQRDGGQTVSTIVHGTFAAWRSRLPPWRRNLPVWWQPGGVFHEYILKTPVSPDLYSGVDFFRWSGAYNDVDRDIAGRDLNSWRETRTPPIVQFHDVYAHSYGGHVALMAADLGTQINLLVLLSVPYYEPPYPQGRIGRMVSIRAKFDVVLVLAGAARRLRGVPEVRPNRWFGHGITHDARFWRDNRLDQRVKYERSFTRLG